MSRHGRLALLGLAAVGVAEIIRRAAADPLLPASTGGPAPRPAGGADDDHRTDAPSARLDEAQARIAEQARRRRVLVERPDLLAEEATRVAAARITWWRRLADLGGDYGRSGGTPADRRAIVEAMVAFEDEVQR